MQSTRKRRGAQVHADYFAVDHPFVGWYASYWKSGSARYVDRTVPQGPLSGDLFMGEVAARRFSIAADDDQVPVLGVCEDDVEAVMSMTWTGAAFLRRVQRRDWVALSCPDARIQGSGSNAPVALRLWLPATMGLLDAWMGATPLPATLRIVEIAVRKGKPEPKGGPPLAVLPLSFKGVWEPSELELAAS